MSMAYDKHMEKALATLEDLSARELEVTGEKLSLRRDSLRSFGLVFGDVTQARRGESWSAGNSRFHLETAVCSGRRPPGRADRGCSGALLGACARRAGERHP
jgi:hypothetical protein